MFIWDGTKDKKTSPSNHTVSVVSSGCSPNHDVLTIRRNGKDDWSLFYCVRGVIHFDDLKIDVFPGQVFIYPPNIPQRYTIYISENTFYHYLHFNGNDLDNLINSLGIETIKPIDVNNDLLAGLIKKIQKIFLNEDACSRITAEYLTLHILTLLAKKQPYISKENIMRKVTEDMELNYPMPYDASKYAKMFSIGISRFNHLFKEIIGDSPLSYYIKVRINNAKLLLECTDLSITEIGQRVGYDDPLYFGQVFKKEVGISPSGYRKNCQNDTIFNENS